MPLKRTYKRTARGCAPPDEWVAHQVDLAVVLAPEVDTALEDGPRRRARVPGVDSTRPALVFHMTC